MPRKTAGYSQTPLASKLGIKEGARVTLLGAPIDFESSLDDVPDTQFSSRFRTAIDVIVFFPKGARELRRRFRSLAMRLVPNGGLWICWPKKASGVSTDLGFELVQRIGLEAGLVDNKVCAVSEVFSGLRFVHRISGRPRLRR